MAQIPAPASQLANIFALAPAEGPPDPRQASSTSGADFAALFLREDEAIPVSTLRLIPEMTAPQTIASLGGGDRTDAENGEPAPPSPAAPTVVPSADIATTVQLPASAAVVAPEPQADIATAQTETTLANARNDHAALPSTPEVLSGARTPAPPPSRANPNPNIASSDAASIETLEIGANDSDRIQPVDDVMNNETKPALTSRHMQAFAESAKVTDVDNPRPVIQPQNGEGADAPVVHAAASSHSTTPLREAPAPLQIVHSAGAPPFTIISATSIAATDGSIEIRLDPPELGRLSIELAPGADGVITAMVAAERPETLDLMRRHGELLLRELARFGFGEASLQFSSRGWNDGNDRPGGERRRLAFSTALESQHVAARAASRRGVERFDLFA